MSSAIIPIPYQIFYIIIPTISIIGNWVIVYVTIRSKSLRSPCAILIGLISCGDIMHMFAHYVMIISHNIAEAARHQNFGRGGSITSCYLNVVNIMEDHSIRHDYCVYWQLFPIFGLIFSSALLTSIAFDRLIATRMFYKRLAKNYILIYLCGHTVPSLCLSATVVTWIFTERRSEEYVICAVTVPFHGSSRTFFIYFLTVTNISTAACYLLYFCLIRLNPLDENIMKQVYRSLVVISLTVVFGWISGVLISYIVEFLEFQVDEVILDLTTGLFVNSATAANFFVYYAVSGMYRDVFNKYLLKGRFKRRLSVTWIT